MSGLLFNSFNKKSSIRPTAYDKVMNTATTRIGDFASSYTGSRLRKLRHLGKRKKNPTMQDFLPEAESMLRKEAPALPLNPISKLRFKMEAREMARGMKDEFQREKRRVGDARKGLAKATLAGGAIAAASRGMLPGTKSLAEREARYHQTIDEEDLASPIKKEEKPEPPKSPEPAEVEEVKQRYNYSALPQSVPPRQRIYFVR